MHSGEENSTSFEHLHQNPTLEEPDNDDKPVGQILSRRKAFTLFGAAGGVLLAGSTCVSAAPSSAGKSPPA